MIEIRNNNQSYSDHNLTYKVVNDAYPNLTYKMNLCSGVGNQRIVRTWENQNYFTSGYHSVAFSEEDEITVQVVQIRPEGLIAGETGHAFKTISLAQPLNGARFTIVLKPDPWFPAHGTEIAIREGN